MQARTLALWALLVALIANVALYLGLAGVARGSCRDVEEIKAYVAAAITRSVETLPTIDYYREHPDELAEQLARLRQQADDFKPSTCPGVLPWAEGESP